MQTQLLELTAILDKETFVTAKGELILDRYHGTQDGIIAVNHTAATLDDIQDDIVIAETICNRRFNSVILPVCCPKKVLDNYPVLPRLGIKVLFPDNEDVIYTSNFTHEGIKYFAATLTGDRQEYISDVEDILGII